MRVMYDSTNASNIPVDAAIVAGYINGPYAWAEADWARFSHAIKVRIATLASVNDGDVLDVENTDATPEQAPGWVAMRRSATGSRQKTVYMSESAWDAVREAFMVQRIPEPEYWVAAYPGPGAVLYPGSVAHQYANSQTSGGDYDLSVVADHWPGVDPEKETEMLILNVANGGGQWLLSGALCVQIEDPNTVTNLTNAGVQQAGITASELSAILAASSSSGGVHTHNYSGTTATS